MNDCAMDWGKKNVSFTKYNTIHRYDIYPRAIFSHIADFDLLCFC